MVLDEYTRIAVRAAYQAGEILKEHFGKLTQVTKKGSIDLVTAADLASEKTVLAIIKKACPDHTMLSEESGMDAGCPEHQWIIDPLDGTTNFVHNLPVFAISIAHAYKETVDVGVVFNPISGELFSAKSGAGATLNGHSIAVSDTIEMENSLIVTGFPYNLHDDYKMLIQRFKYCLKAAQGIRRLGSAALDLCYVACGRFDGFWEERLNPWDTAAGTLIAQEAGGRLTDFEGRSYHINGPEILATNGKIHSQMIGLLNQKEST